MKKACALWTGGKDCCYATLLAQREGWTIDRLIVFVPEGDVAFKAHPIEVMRCQAEAMRVTLETISITEPYREGYIEAFRSLRGVEAVITGDIDLVDGYPNWIDECVQVSGASLQVLKPLWNRDREEVLAEMIEAGIEIVMSYINHPKVPQGWIGQVIDRNRLEELKALHQSEGVDICGENGEFHTMVIHCPLFTKRIYFDRYQ